MSSLFEKLAEMETNFDVIIDPEIGKLELLELGIAELTEFDNKERYAYASDQEVPQVRQIILVLAENLGITGDNDEAVDETGKPLRIEIDPDALDWGGYWLTFWYDGGISSIHHQSKLDILIIRHAEKMPDRYDFFDYRKKIWIKKVAEDAEEDDDFSGGMDLDSFNRFIKKKNLLWLLEDITGMGYDVYDFLQDINKKIKT